MLVHVLQGVDRELKRVCEDVIADCGNSVVEPLQTWLDQCNKYLTYKSSRGQTPNLTSQPWATPERMVLAHDEFKAAVNQQIPTWTETLVVYLQDEATVRVLIPPMQSHVLDIYRTFYDVARQEYDHETVAHLMTPPALHDMLQGLESRAFSSR